ncbi:Alpha/Beta hydrolase protein [Lentinula raphanica]|uniref:Alpha/Beta hydrolase protein n=1 Tax=Lentinula raphanica TaxID=153919 RepID=A0AA38U451_9AGAR|nr:Alpha/Beta hydrolase protein [Lentinula raphanica]KAJ3832019.1 Alpha/Beta hydrolase protein [Lentinula raphanica]KAJ3964431.1 Alpha/Beta hydrolase protein [Lentinula raphanica]
MSSVNKEILNVGGLPVQVFSSVKHNTSKPVFILFFLHGRMGKADDIENAIKIVYDNLAGYAELKQDLVVVSFDHRNHGGRLIDNKANLGWDEDESKTNIRHGIDMFAIQDGSSRDVSFLVDYLPAYLYPESERKISGWGLAGISLGGHSTWTTLARDPRIQVGIPIIGCPDYLTLISKRAEQFGISLDSASKYFPESVLTLIKKEAPPATPYLVEDVSNPFFGKKILVLSGAADPLVPWFASESFVEGLKVGPNGYKKVVVQPDTGHTVAPEMLKELAVFLEGVVLGV